MSYFKFAPDLFLEKQELERIRLFLDDEGFRKFLLKNTLSFGLINERFFFVEGDAITKGNDFYNGLIVAGDALGSIVHKKIEAIDSNGNLIYSLPSVDDIPVPSDSNWYWVKIKHIFSSLEKGKYSIDLNGNLVCTTGDGELTKILRGQPNFPSRISFKNAVDNTLEYDVLEVIDDNNAILQGTFTVAEINLTLTVIGTFSPGTVPISSDKEPFQYDSCIFSLIQETSFNIFPVLIKDQEFILARVKFDGATLVIQDKRTQIYKTNSSYKYEYLDHTTNPVFGIEKIKFDHVKSTRDKNLVYLSWGMRSTNWSINTNLNTLTIISGQGGKYKTVNDFFDRDFDGWRLYTPDGNYQLISSSLKIGGAINLTLDYLNIDSFSEDGGVTLTQAEIFICPDIEEVEVNFRALFDASDSSETDDEEELSNQKFVFPVNTIVAKCPVLPYIYNNDDINNIIDTCEYEVTYRAKHNDHYSLSWLMDYGGGTGWYYTEDAFDKHGEFLQIVKSNTFNLNVAQGYIRTHINSLIILKMCDTSYSRIVDYILTGDLYGVETRTFEDATNVYDCEVGTNLVYQFFDGSSYTMGADKYINVKGGLRNGNYFLLHIKQAIHPDVAETFKLRIVSDFVNTSSYTLLKEFDQRDHYFLQRSDQGTYYRISYDGTKWIINSVNEVKDFVPIGCIFDYAKTSAPFGYLMCNGQAVNRTKFAELFAVIGTNFGIGDGSTTFNVPDLRSRVSLGLEDRVSDPGGIEANKWDTNYQTLGFTGGEKEHQLTEDELAAHNHDLQVQNNANANSGGEVGRGDNQDAVNVTEDAGGDEPHENRQPFIVLNKIIKAL